MILAEIYKYWFSNNKKNRYLDDFWLFFNGGHYLLQPDVLWFVLPVTQIHLRTQCEWTPSPPVSLKSTTKSENNDEAPIYSARAKMMIQYNLSNRRERNRNFTDQSGRTVVFSLRLTAKRLISFRFYTKLFLLTVIIFIRTVTLCPSLKYEQWGVKKLDYFSPNNGVLPTIFISCSISFQNPSFKSVWHDPIWEKKLIFASESFSQGHIPPLLFSRPFLINLARQKCLLCPLCNPTRHQRSNRKSWA